MCSLIFGSITLSKLSAGMAVSVTGRGSLSARGRGFLLILEILEIPVWPTNLSFLMLCYIYVVFVRWTRVLVKCPNRRER